jgi:hypothetical protein
MSMHLRALYLSILLCTAAALAACWLRGSFSIAGLAAACAAAERQLALLLPHAAAGTLAGALLLAADALYGRPYRGAPRPVFPGVRQRTRRGHLLGEPAVLHPVEREAFARLAEHHELPADPLTPGGGSLYEQGRREWLAAAKVFGAGTLESQLAVLRHMGKLLAIRKTPDGPAGYFLAAEPAPLAMQALRQFDSLSALTPEARRELMQALYALQTGWIAIDLPPRTAQALQRLGRLGTRRREH